MPSIKTSSFYYLSLVVLIAYMSIHQSAIAQSTQTTDSIKNPKNIQEKYDDAFQMMLRDPSNIDKTLRYAVLASVIGDLEGAIGAYSRLLILLPEKGRVRYELGILYFRLKSYALARSYLVEAQESESFPPNLKPKAARFLDEIARRTSTNTISGLAVLGVRYQSNINGAGSAGTQQIASNAVLRDSTTEKEDFEIFGSIDLKHLYDLNRVDGTKIETNLQLYGAKPMTEDEFDLGFVELDTGPVFEFQEGTFRGLSIRPYAVIDYLHLGQSRLYDSSGGGVRLAHNFNGKTLAKASYELRDRVYRNSSERPTVSNVDGVEHTWVADMTQVLKEFIRLNASLTAISLNASAPFESFTEFGGKLGVAVNFEAPLYVTTGQWTSFLTLEYSKTRYDEQNPNANSGKTRMDQRWTFRFANQIPLTRDLFGVIAMGYLKNGSNDAIFEYDNFDISIALAYKF